MRIIHFSINTSDTQTFTHTLTYTALVRANERACEREVGREKIDKIHLYELRLKSQTER